MRHYVYTREVHEENTPFDYAQGPTQEPRGDKPPNRRIVDPTSINHDIPLPLTREEWRFVCLIGGTYLAVLVIAGLLIYWSW
jgi:hypothetical protein